MKNIIILVCLAFGAMNLKGQLPDNFYHHYEGTLAGVEVSMDLVKEGYRIYGFYHYKSVGQIILLEGKMEPGNSFEMKEYIQEARQEKITGIFSGNFVSADRLKGSWQASDTTDAHDFDLATDYSNSLPMDVVFFKKVKQLFSDLETPALNINYMIMIPGKPSSRLKSRPLLDSIGQMAIGTNSIEVDTREKFESYAENLYEEYTVTYDFVTRDDEYLYSYNQEESIGTSVLFNDDYIVSYEFGYYSYTGGAHGNYSASYLVFNSYSGAFVDLDEIFKPGYEQVLTPMITDKIKEQHQDENTGEKPDLTAVGFFESSIGATNNFYVDKSGIYFVYNPYEIAPYAIGLVKVYISWKEVSKIINPKGPVHNFYLK